MDFRKWQEEQLKQRKVEIKNENSFFARKGELEELEVFISDDKTQIFCLYGVPMIGKTTLVRQFLKNVKEFEIKTIQFNNPENPEITLDNKLTEIDWTSRIPKLIIVENFEVVLEWKGSKNRLHGIKYETVRRFLEYVSRVPFVKVILESRFRIKLDFLPRIYTTLSTHELEGIDRRELYNNLNKLRDNKVSFETFERVCEKFDDHVWLIEMAMQDDWHFPDIKESITHPRSVTQNLWDKLEQILKKLPTSQRILLCAISIVNPISEIDLEKELKKLSIFQKKDELESGLFSLRKKLLTVYNNQTISYEINPFLREVCFTFLKEQKEMKILETLPYFRRLPKPKFDLTQQAHEKGDYKTFFRVIREKRKRREHGDVFEILETALESNSKREIILTEIAITHKEIGNLPIASELLLEVLDIESIEELSQKLSETKDYKALNELGIILKEQENYDDAIPLLERAAELGNIHSYNELAIIYKEQENYPKAIEILNEGLKKERNNEKLLNELAKCYREIDDLDESVKTSKYSIECNLTNVPSYLTLAETYLYFDYPDDAEGIIKQGVRRCGNDFHFDRLNERIRKAKENPKVQNIPIKKNMSQISSIKEISSVENETYPICDYAIITALEETEMERVLPMITKIGKVKNDKHLVEYGHLKSNSQKTIVYASQLSTGMVDAAILATEILIKFKPKFLIMAGVLGGKPEEVKIGDVIVVTKVFTSDKGKLTDLGFKPEIESSNSDSSHITSIKRAKDDILAYLKKEDSRRQAFNIHFGPIACVRQVIDLEGFFDEKISPIDRKAVALEMESYGISRACEIVNDGKTLPIIIKSAMDNTQDKVDGAKPLAAWTSAMTIKYILENDII